MCRQEKFWAADRRTESRSVIPQDHSIFRTHSGGENHTPPPECTGKPRPDVIFGRSCPVSSPRPANRPFRCANPGELSRIERGSGRCRDEESRLPFQLATFQNSRPSTPQIASVVAMPRFAQNVSRQASRAINPVGQ